MNKKKILFIEDEIDQIVMVQTRLEGSGYEVIGAMDGEEGLKKVHEENPDLILLDLIIPKIDGFEVCRRLRGCPDTSNIPVIVITASGTRDVEGKCRAVGADEIIRKPYESTDLVSKIKALLREQSVK